VKLTPSSSASNINTPTSTSGTDENEISSSKGSRALSESSDPSAVTGDENNVTSAVSGQNTQETEDDRSPLQSSQERKTCSSRARRVRKPSARVCFDEEEFLLGRCHSFTSHTFRYIKEDVEDEQSWSDSSHDEDDDDRCLLDNQPVCTMGVLPDDEEVQLGRGRLQSASSIDENSNSTAPSRPQSRSDSVDRNQPTISSTDASGTRPPPGGVNKLSSFPGHVPDIHYMDALLSRPPSAPFNPSIQGYQPPHFPPAKHTPTSVETVDSKTRNPFDSEHILPSSQDMKHEPPGMQVSAVHGNPNHRSFADRPPFLSGDSMMPGFSPRFPLSGADNRLPLSSQNPFDKQQLEKQHFAESLLKQAASHGNPGAWPFPNMMPPSVPPHTVPKESTTKSKVHASKREKGSDVEDPLKNTGSATPVSGGFQPSSLSGTPPNSGQLTAPKITQPVTSVTSTSGGSQPGNVISIPPGSAQYHQIFIYQHQLLIMQFQQYQFQLQAQFQHLSVQQMSSQQLVMLSQQFNQQMMLLQRQFTQQQVCFITALIICYYSLRRI